LEDGGEEEDDGAFLITVTPASFVLGEERLIMAVKLDG